MSVSISVSSLSSEQLCFSLSVSSIPILASDRWRREGVVIGLVWVTPATLLWTGWMIAPQRSVGQT